MPYIFYFILQGLDFVCERPACSEHKYSDTFPATQRAHASITDFRDLYERNGAKRFSIDAFLLVYFYLHIT